jgi:PKD repeat protein
MWKFIITSILLFNLFNLTSQIVPTDIPGLAHWYSADSVSISSNSLVDTVYDLSANDDHFYQLNYIDQPLLLNSSFNHRPIIRFNGTEFLESIFSQTIVQGYTVFAVWKSNISSKNVFLDDRMNVMIDNKDGGHVRMFAGIEVSYLKSNPFEFIVTQAEFNGNSSKLYENSVLKAQGTVGGNNLPGITMGKRTLFNDRFFHGDFSQLLIYESVLSQNQIDSVLIYLQHYHTEPLNLGQNISQYGYCDTTLYAGERFESYLWSDGSTADSLIATQPGIYWVETVDIFGFTSSDTIEVFMGDFQYPTTQLYCQNDSIIWNTGLGQHYSYLWSDNSTGDTLEIDSPGDYHVTVTDTNGCIFESDTLTFAEDPFSTLATLGPDLSLCSGNDIALTAGATSATNYIWNTNDITPEITITTTGTYSVIVENANGCEVKDTIDVTILGDAPIVNTQLPSITCVGEEFNFQDLSTTTDGSTIIGWDWDLGDGTTSLLDQGNHAYSAGGIYNVDLTVETSAGCFNNQTATIEVKENPIVTYAASNQCEDESIQFNGGQLSPQSIASWEWNFDDPASGIDNIASGQNPFHTFDTAGDFDVMLIGTDVFGCVDTLIQTKTIEPTPVADFSFTEVCEGNTVNFQNNSTVSSPSVISGNQWSFGDGTNSNQSNPQKPYSLYGTYTVDLTTSANNGCSHSISKNIKIHATPQVQYSINQACAGLETSFKDNSFVPDGSVAQVNWKFGNETPISGFDITNIFSNSGTYTLEQTVNSGFGCINSAVSTITINPYLNADFIFTPNAFIAEYPIAFESTSSGENSYLWSFGNIANSTQADTSIIFEENLIGTEQTVELRVENQWNCSDSMSVKLPVLEQRTDLEISQIFSQDINGFLTIGVRLKNIGSTPISEVDLVLNSPSTGLIKETWVGMLQADEEEIYIFSANPSAKISAEDTLQNFLCIEGTIVLPAQFIEEDFSNNEVCKTMTDNQTVIVFPYPNPVKDELTVKVVLPKKGVIALNVYDSFGKIIHTITEKQELEKGLTIFIVETGAWSNGRYTIVYEGEGSVPSVGFVKL